jgi:hypothetical protein
MVVQNKNKGLGDISHLHYGGQEHAVETYIHSLLFGELKEHLAEKGIKVFKGISKEFSRKYMKRFNEMLKLNDYTRGPMDNAFTLEYDGHMAYEHIAFFVFQNGRGNAFGSFPTAYKFANDMYLFNNMILGNATKILAKNTDVKFGRVIVQDGSMVEKDLESVVNKDFYKSLIIS